MQLLINDQKFATWKRAGIYNYLKMTIVFIRNLREIGHTEDIIIITNHEPFIEIIEKEGAKVTIRPIFDYPALHQYKCNAWGLSIFDMQKIQFWTLTEYDKVLGIDNDMLAVSKFTDWHLPEPIIVRGRNKRPNNQHTWTANSSIMLIEPSLTTFNEMFKIIKTASFSPTTGWNECGTINCGSIGTIEHWDYQSANAMQGFLPYYFKDRIQHYYWNKIFTHYAGDLKYTDETYVAECRKHGFELIKAP